MEKRVTETKNERLAARRESIVSDAVVLREGNISLILENYHDIFSDFDPRPYSERALSDDFLLECKKATIEKKGDIELRLLVPKHKRNINDEIKIKKRLKDHFRKHYMDMEKEVNEVKMSGLLLILLGMVMMFAAYLFYSETFAISVMLTNILLVITEPSGWFFFWIGGEKLVYGLREKKPNHDFYKKMNNAKVYFFEY